MHLTITSTAVLTAVNVILAPSFAIAFPAYADSMGGLAKRQVEDVAATSQSGSQGVFPPNPPGPLAFSGAKLVDDAAHPWRPLRQGDLRGPCPGLNTLASHGYLPRDGVATPTQIINAVQEGFNMDNNVARTATYLAHVVNGNLVTDLLSIGAKTPKTGPDPPKPAIVGGDAFFGDNFSFNQTLFDQFKDFSQRFGGGLYNLTVGAELRWERFQQSRATNPTFSIVGLRQITAYGEPAFVANLFVDGRKTAPGQKGHLDMASAENFFKDMRYPKGFFRAAQPSGAEGANIIFATHPTETGRNVGQVNNYVADNSLGGILDQCLFYTQFLNVTVKGLYPNPTGILRRSLKINLGFLYDAFVFPTPCPEVFPYGP